MKLLSIDVGMKNLAFCLMDLNDNTYLNNKICKWGVINLCEDEIVYCKEKTKQTCEKSVALKAFIKFKISFMG